jgi:hypothetical protein
MIETTKTISINKSFDKIEIRKLLFIDNMAYITIGYYAVENEIEIKAPNDYNVELSLSLDNTLQELNIEEREKYGSFIDVILNKAKQIIENR